MAWLSAVLIVCFTLFLGGIAYCGRNFLKSNAASFFTQLDGDGRETEDRTGFRRTIGTWNFEPEVVTVGDDGEKKSKAKAPMNLIDVVSPRGSDESAVVSEGEGDVEANSSGHGPVHVVRRVEVDSAGGKSGADKEDTPKKGFLGLFGGGSGSSKVSPTPTPRGTGADEEAPKVGSRLSQEGSLQSNGEGRSRENSLPDGEASVVLSA